MANVEHNTNSPSNSKYFYKQYKEAHQRIQEAGKRFVQNQATPQETKLLRSIAKIINISITCTDTPRTIPVLVTPSKKPEIQEITRVYPRVADILEAVSGYYGISVLELISERRTKPYVWPRQIAIWFCCVLTPYSTVKIGKHFGGRDHTTVLHARDKVERLLIKDDGLQNETREIAHLLVRT